MANNPAYVHHMNEDDASTDGSQSQSNTYESVMVTRTTVQLKMHAPNNHNNMIHC